MAKETIGTFTIRNEGNGCLTSKYLEHNDITPYVEASKRTIIGIIVGDQFVGDYDTTWIEASNVTIVTTLNITLVGEVYHFTWGTITGNPTKYEGRAMLVNENLVGVFWNTN